MAATDGNTDGRADLQSQLEQLKSELAAKDREIVELKQRLAQYEPPAAVAPGHSLEPVRPRERLTNAEISRYSRQLLLPEFRVAAQLRLLASSALIVGCGGLGCPAGAYLAASGLARIGLVDFDEVDLSNLHRQILHTEDRVGRPKSVSLAASLRAINSSVDLVPFQTALDSTNALDIIRQFDVVLDCTDNVATRYLLNDACVIAGKPLVSGSALRWEGQLTIYNYKGGPTYRCLYPEPPPPAAVTNCSDGGVLGAVPGVIGCLQAVETIKILSGLEPAYSGKLFLFDAASGGRCRTVGLRQRRPEADELKHLVDYVQFCGSAATDKDQEVVRLLTDDDQITAQGLADVLRGDERCVVVDVRTEPEMEMGSLGGSINIPLSVMQNPASRSMVMDTLAEDLPVYVVCRRGNDSQKAVMILRELLPGRPVTDVKGGLHAWAKHVDNSFPVY